METEVNRATSEMEERLTDEPYKLDNDGQPVPRTISEVIPPYRVKRPHATTWIHVEMEQEKRILNAGKPASGVLLKIVADSDRNLELRARLAILLGRMGDATVGNTLKRIAQRDTDPLIRQCCWTSLGLLRARDQFAEGDDQLGQSDPDKMAILWAMGVCGSGRSLAEYFERVEQVIHREETEQITDLGGASIPFISDQQQHLNLRAKKTPGSEYLELDIWRIGQIHKPRAIGVLIRSLGYHDTHVQHMAFHLLRALVEDGPEFQGPVEFDLHSLVIYSAWKRWWDAAASELAWDESTKKYRIAGSTR